jgi:ADP-heptose:LPS heptosyltransferase
MASRFPVRVVTLLHALARLVRLPWRRKKAAAPARILVLQHLLLGDTLMLTALLKKLRQRYPEAHIALTCRPQFQPLYATRPYGVQALAYDERDLRTLRRLLREPAFDLTVIPAENRLSLLARAMGSRWIVAFDGYRPAAKSWLVDELRSFPPTPMAWCDLACLLVDGPAPLPYRAGEWPQPSFTPAVRLEADYCVLHVGARSRLKSWDAGKWRALAERLEARGLQVVLSTGRDEAAVLDEIDPQGTRMRLPGTLALDQVWGLLARARLLVCLDNGISHLARIAGVPVVVLFGGGSAGLYGGGHFWSASPQRIVTIPDFPCRDVNVVFRRTVSWVRTCARTESACASAKCMQAISLDPVWGAAEELLDRRAAGSATSTRRAAI